MKKKILFILFCGTFSVITIFKIVGGNSPITNTGNVSLKEIMVMAQAKSERVCLSSGIFCFDGTTINYDKYPQMIASPSE